MLQVYSPQVTPRISFIFDLIFKNILGLEYRVTDNREAFLKCSGPRLNYSGSRFDSEVFIESSGLLFDKGVRPQALRVSAWNGTKMFYETSAGSDLPFDIFAASFWLVTRYEEYLPSIRDKHNRFMASESLAIKNDFLQRPLVNIWSAILKELLLTKFPGLVFTPPEYSYISTFDLDNVYCYKGKSWWRNAGGAVKSLMRMDFSGIGQRIKVLSGKIPDPYDHYDFHRSLQKQYGIPIIYFLLYAKKSRFDGAVSRKSAAYQALIETVKKYAETGIHPSYFSGEKPGLLLSEVIHLAKALQKPVTKSRQHFLKLSFPATYQNLVKAGITEDYSMGYQSHPGFRAAICTPYFFFDLKTETVTNLKIFPFCIMDSTLYDYMKLSPADAWPHIKSLVEEVKNVNGTLITIWHDRTFCNTGLYKGWKALFAEMVKIASTKKF
ncbi:MAG TPA: polysaccharide deacetylase family protein [Bacteroidales bacterium]|nr:polysaccharide deacetylase family protein [Bacteroidales bacterium]